MKKRAKKWFSLAVVLLFVLAVFVLPTSSAFAYGVIANVDPADTYNYVLSYGTFTINSTEINLIHILDILSYTFYHNNQIVGENSSLPANRLEITYSGNKTGSSAYATIEGEFTVLCNKKEIYYSALHFYAGSSVTFEFDLSGTIGNIFVPQNYDFSRDRYSFRNFSEAIDKKYYTETFGAVKGDALYRSAPDLGKNGHCFGIAISTIATLIGGPSVTDYISWTGLPYQQLSSVNKGTSNIDLGMTAKEYIKCCFIYQRSYEIWEQRNSASHQGIQNVYNAVLSGVGSSKTTGIAIDLWGGPGGHTVYACGVDGNDILIDDSNSSTQTRIHVNGNTWSYSGGGLSWSSASGCTINYVDSYIVPYLRIVASVRPSDVVLSDGSVVTGYTESSELDGSFELWNYSIADIMDQGRNLAIFSEGDFDLANASDFLKIETTDGVDGSESSAYWLKDDVTSIEANNISNSSSEIKLASDDLSITASVPVKATTQMSVGEDDYFNMDCEQGDPIEFTITTESINGELIDLVISGTADDDHIDAVINNSTIDVQGLSNGSVMLKRNDNIVEEKDFDKADANVEIIYDNAGENDTLIVSDDNEGTPETPSTPEKPTDANSDEKCKYCDTVHPNTFIGKITKFFHSILYFFAHLFGKM